MVAGARVQKLHLVGYTADHEGLVFSARKGAKSGGFVVALNDSLVDTISEARRLRDSSHEGLVGARGHDLEPRQPRPESLLTPREMQARIRSGRSIAEVAAEAGVDEDWVDRFAVPVIAEQGLVVERARDLTYAKPRLGLSYQPLGTSVAWNVADRGVSLSSEEFEEGWSAYQQHDGSWVVRFAYTSRSRRQVAAWELDGDELVSRNRLASALAYVSKGRRRGPVFRADDAPSSTRRVRRARARPAARPGKPATRAPARTRATRAPARTRAKAAKPVAKTAARKPAKGRKAAAAGRRPRPSRAR